MVYHESCDQFWTLEYTKYHGGVSFAVLSKLLQGYSTSLPSFHGTSLLAARNIRDSREALTTYNNPPNTSPSPPPDINCPRKDAGYLKNRRPSSASCVAPTGLLDCWSRIRLNCRELESQQGHQSHLPRFHRKARNVSRTG